jgi:hypothetical protein
MFAIPQRISHELCADARNANSCGFVLTNRTFVEKLKYTSIV